MAKEAPGLWTFFIDPRVRRKIAAMRLTGREREMFDIIQEQLIPKKRGYVAIPLKVFKVDMGIDGSHLSKLREGLLKRNMIKVKNQGRGLPLLYAIQKDISKWKPLYSSTIVSKDNTTIVPEASPPLYSGTIDTPGPNISFKDSFKTFPKSLSEKGTFLPSCKAEYKEWADKELKEIVEPEIDSVKDWEKCLEEQEYNIVIWSSREELIGRKKDRAFFNEKYLKGLYAKRNWTLKKIKSLQIELAEKFKSSQPQRAAEH